jgi:hypothetical protein
MKYGRYLSKVLSEKLRDLQASYYGAITLRDELAVFQHFFGEAMSRYENAMLQRDQAAEAAEKIKWAAAMSLAREEVLELGDRVRDMATAAARMEADERMISVGMAHGMLAQMCQIMDDELHAGLDDPDAISFRVAERARLELTKVEAVAEISGSDKTRLLPANEEAMAMDETIPEVA